MQAAPDELPPRPAVGAALLGAVRVAAVFGAVVVGTVLLLGAALVPVRPGGARPAERVAVELCRAFLRLTGLTLRVEHAERLLEHRGFVFFNHVSWLDPIVLVAVRPLRFLSTQGVRRLPFIGWIATALGTIYVNRGRDASREAARGALREAVRREPTPVAVAPEGKIGPGPGVLPFRRGAFEVAAEAGAEVLLVALRFEPRAYSLWVNREWLMFPLWRLCARTTPVVATVAPLTPALDPEAANPEALAAEAEHRLDVALGATPEAATPPRPVP